MDSDICKCECQMFGRKINHVKLSDRLDKEGKREDLI